MLRWVGFWTEAEQADSRLPHRPDVRAQGFTLPLTHFEVHVSHPSRLDDAAQVRRGSSNCAFVEEAWRRRLAAHYGGGPPPNAPFQLIPAVVSSFGGWHPEFAQWWRGAVRAAAERAGPAGASVQGMLWRSVGFLSVTLQRQNFQVLAGCAPSRVEEVEGRLGRPLSEVPEFCRAAPEAAVLWGEDEFEFPPSPRGGSLGQAAPDLNSAAGHLRAAGIRL